MAILAFDTATAATTVALCSPADDLWRQARDDPPPGVRPRHATALLPLIDELLEGHSGPSAAAWEAIELVAVGVGPGTFTGLRIGIATARALAWARGLPLTGVSTLRSLALNSSLEAPAEADAVLAVLDARRSEVFTAAWRPAEIEAGEPLLAPVALAPDALADLASSLGDTVLALGDGAVEFRAILEPSGVSIPEDDSKLHRVTAISHCRIARLAVPSEPDQILPEYLRIPDAEFTRRARARE